MNWKQIIIVWLLAGWLAFSFGYAARHVEEPSLVDRATAKVKGEPPPTAQVRYEFVWDRDAGTLLLLALPGLLIGIPLILTLGRHK